MERSYDYRAKNAVRQAWMQFLPQADAAARGLYLPAAENLELPGYRAKGFVPGQLLGCERDPSRAAQLAAASGGIVLVPGIIRDGVARVESLGWPRLTAINLDFDGSAETHTEDLLSIFRVFPADPAGYLSVTSYAARDDECLEQGMANLNKFAAGLDREGFFREIGIMRDRWRSVRRLLGSRAPQHHAMNREIGLLWWLAMGMTVADYDGDGYGRLNEQFLTSLEEVLQDLTRLVADQSRGAEYVLVDEPRLAALLEKRMASCWPTDLQHFAYTSLGGQPMRTWFLRICPLSPPDQPTAREIVAQLWQLAVRSPLVCIDEAGGRITIE